MSVQAISWVFENSPAKGAARLTHLALANYAGNDELLAWPSVGTLARITAQTDRAVQKALRQLEEAELIRQHGKRRTGTIVYQLLVGGEPGSPPWVNVVREGVNDVQAEGERGSPEPSFNHSKEPLGSPAPTAGPNGPPGRGSNSKARMPQNLPQAVAGACPFNACDGSAHIVDDEERTTTRCRCHPSYVAVAA